MQISRIGRRSETELIDFRGYEPNGPRFTGRTLYLNVAIVLVVLLGINVVVAWVLQFYFNESIMSMVSYVAPDASWVPTDTNFRPALGVHYFGDFEQYVGYARSSLPPFSLPDAHISAYGPASIVLVKVLDLIFKWPGEVFVFLLGSLATFFIGIVRIMGRGLDTFLVALLLLVSGPVIVTLDRGNFQLLIAGLCALFCVGVLKERAILIVAPLALAIAIKAYTALLLLVLIKKKRWRDLAITCAAVVVLFLVCFFLVPGAFFSNVRGFIDANLFFGSAQNSFIADVASVTGVIYKFLLLAWGPIRTNGFYSQLPGWVIQIPGLVVGVLCIAILGLAKKETEIELIAVLAMMQLAPVGAFPYLELNVVIELCLLLRLLSGSGFVNNRSRDPELDVNPHIPVTNARLERRLLLFSTFILTFGVAPWVFRFGSVGTIITSAGPSTNATAAWLIIGPVANLLCLLCLLLVTWRSRFRKIDPRMT